MLLNAAGIPLQFAAGHAGGPPRSAQDVLQKRHLDPTNITHLFYFLCGAGSVLQMRVDEGVKGVRAMYPERSYKPLRRDVGLAIMALRQAADHVAAFIELLPEYRDQVVQGEVIDPGKGSRTVSNAAWYSLAEPIADAWQQFAGHVANDSEFLEAEWLRQAVNDQELESLGLSVAAREVMAFGLIQGALYVAEYAIRRSQLDGFPAELIRGPVRRMILDLDGYMPTTILMTQTAVLPLSLQLRCN